MRDNIEKLYNIVIEVQEGLGIAINQRMYPEKMLSLDALQMRINEAVPIVASLRDSYRISIQR